MTGRATDLGGDGERRRRGGRRRLKDGKVTAGQNNTLSARWHKCACARHGERSELGRRGPVRAGGGGRGLCGPAEEGEAGAGRRRRARPARAGGGGPQWGGRERGREGETV